MRWPFRSRRRSARPGPRWRSAETAPPHRQWTRLPPLLPTVAMWPPTLTPTLRAPEVTTTRQLLRPRHRYAPLPLVVPVGRVFGLASLGPAVARDLVIPHGAAAEPAPPPIEPGHPAPVHRPALDRPPAVRQPLTEATDAHVGAPRPAEQQRGVDLAAERRRAKFERALKDPAVQSNPNILLDPSMLDELVGDISFDEDTGAGPQEPAAGETRTQVVMRRASLAESRRLGLRDRVRADSEPPHSSDNADNAEAIDDIHDIDDAAGTEVDSDEQPSTPIGDTTASAPAPEPDVEWQPDRPVGARSPEPEWFSHDPGAPALIHRPAPAPPWQPQPVDAEPVPDGMAPPPEPPAVPPSPWPTPAPEAGRPLGLGAPIKSRPVHPAPQPSEQDRKNEASLFGTEPEKRPSPLGGRREPPPRVPTRQSPAHRPAPPGQGTLTTTDLPAPSQPEQPMPSPELSTADSAAPGWGTSSVTQQAPVYRAAIAEVPPHIDVPGPPLPVDDADTSTLPVPWDISEVFRTTFGVRVDTVPVRRGPAVSRHATALAARAFTHRGQVHLPDEAGALGDRDTRALLAHELVHATQQRMLGPALPREDSAEGAQLEEKAVATERWFRGEGPPPAALVHRPPSPEATAAVQAAEYARQVAEEIAELPAAVPEALQRADDTAVADLVPHELKNVIGREFLAWSINPPETMPAAAPDADLAALISGLSQETTNTASGGITSVDELAAALRNALAGTGTQGGIEANDLAAALDRMTTAVEESAASNANTTIDLDDTEFLDRLATKLYRPLRGKLRLELLVDRERTGTLADPR